MLVAGIVVEIGGLIRGNIVIDCGIEVVVVVAAAGCGSCRGGSGGGDDDVPVLVGGAGSAFVTARQAGSVLGKVGPFSGDGWVAATVAGVGVGVSLGNGAARADEVFVLGVEEFGEPELGLLFFLCDGRGGHLGKAARVFVLDGLLEWGRESQFKCS